MNVRDEYSNAKFEAVRALIVYRSREKTFCTLNRIEDGKILTGVPVDEKKLSGLFELTGREEKQFTEGNWQWQDARILAKSQSAVIWYAAPRLQEIFFSCKSKNLMHCSGNMFPWPGMVFLAKSHSLRVFAVKSKPDKTTKLYHAPFWNITNGNVCLPAVVRKDLKSIDEWEKIFYTSAFSHPGGTKTISKTKFDKLIPALIRRGAKRFPVSELIDAKLNMKDLMEGK